MTWGGFTLLHPVALFAGVAAVVVHVVSRRRPAPSIVVSAVTFGAAPASDADVGALWKTLGMILLSVALARPVGRELVEDPARGIDIALVTDISSSMLTKDLAPGSTRLDVAKEAADRFIAARGDDRIAFVTFARHPDLACPATRDHGALRKIVASTSTTRADGPEDATGIGYATAFACDILRRRGEGSRVVVLLSDGEENVATTTAKDAVSPNQSGAAAAALGIRVHTVALGKGSRGSDGVVRPLDTTELRRISALSGGLSFEAGDAAALVEVYAKLDALEPSRSGTPRIVFHEWFLWWLLPGLLVWTLGWLRSTSSRGAMP